METIAIIDTETGGLDCKVHPLLEVGCVTWSVEHRAIIAARSWLVYADANEAEHINHIPAAMLADARPRLDVIAEVQAMTRGCGALAAHRAEFDAGFLPELAGPWLCTKFDIEWPGVPVGSSLSETSLALLGYATRGHRALADCLTLARCFEKVGEMLSDEGFGAWLARTMRPRTLFEVSDKSFSAERNALAKEHGFRWQPERRLWTRRLAVEDAAALPFRVQRCAP